MKTIYICYDNSVIKSKFIENIKNLRNISTIQTTTNIDIFKYLHLGVKNYIIHYSKLDSYSMYFLEQQKDADINVYIDVGSNIIKNIDTKKLFNAKYLTTIIQENLDNKIIDISKYIDPKFLNIISKNKINIACGFLTELSEIPHNLVLSLQSKMDPGFRIRLFDNRKINHPFNVGMINEKQKHEILQSYKYFINIDGAYLNEAIASRCIVLDKNLEEDSVTKFDYRLKDILPIDSFVENFCL